MKKLRLSSAPIKNNDPQDGEEVMPPPIGSQEARRARARKFPSHSRRIKTSPFRQLLQQFTAFVLLVFCASSWAVFAPPSVSVYSLTPSGATGGNADATSPQAVCSAFADDFANAALRIGWASAWVTSATVRPAGNDPVSHFCDVQIGQCLSDGFCTGSSATAGIYQLLRNRCPINSSSISGGCGCDTGYQEDGSQTSCLAALPEPQQLSGSAQSCKAPGRSSSAGELFGAPVAPASGDKSRFEIDLVITAGTRLTFARSYHSAWGLDAGRQGGALGKAWSHNHETSLKTTASDASGGATAVAINFSEGFVRTFGSTAGAQAWSATNGADTLARSSDQGWIYRRADDDATYRFDASGKLQSVSQRNGWAHSYSYNAAGQLATVVDNFGHGLTFVHDTNGRLLSVATLDGRQTGYAFDATGRLSSVSYPGGKTRSFAYENASFPHALTGIQDESGARWGSFAYDAQGRAISTELAGGVSRYQVSYPVASAATVIDPLSTSRNFSYGTTKGKLAVTAGSLPSGEGESDAASRTQDANGLITSETDF
ncbi:DUF6531 domain-containing protein, partial [Variovorax sp. KK3]|uniref:DUF6531 domain-containing protein n=1 Tax=Variovorax sp. KK3 TaxID=1855728 RepID=UPI0011807B10